MTLFLKNYQIHLKSKIMVYISNPNGGENDSKSSGWYKFKEIIPYIAKALYIESYN